MPRAPTASTAPVAKDASAALRALADAEVAAHAARYFKTGPGEYGEGDQFLGLRVPQVRAVARAHREMPLPEVRKLLASGHHEERLCAALILVTQFQRGDEKTRGAVYRAYVAGLKHLNNWDLVDTSAPHIVGGWLQIRSRKQLYTWARSRDLWKRRIAIMGTFAFIREGEFADTLAIAEILLNDEHDLIHKAVGWMLREVGNLDRAAEEAFLKQHYQSMPRTMLRYAIEKFPEKKRQAYLKGRV